MATMIKTVGPALHHADGNREKTRERSSGPGGLPGIAFDTVRRLWCRLRLRQERRRVELELKSLSDFQLKDLGFHRSEIGSIVHGVQRDNTRRRYSSDAAGWPKGSKSG